MNTAFFLLSMTVVAVISDTMLIPFYPQFFAQRFGMESPEHVGAYLAAMSATVILALPIWARVARKLAVIKLLVITQIAAGLLCLYCMHIESLAMFWLVSLCMIACKASYLLIYPFMMRLQKPERHVFMASLLSIVIHFGGIFGAIIGGVVLDRWSVEDVFLFMAAGDAIQTLICIYLLCSGKVTQKPGEAHVIGHGASFRARRPLYLLGIAMMLFYFSAYLVRPFFAEHWQLASGIDNTTVSGLAFAIPAGMALLALWSNHASSRSHFLLNRPVPCLILGALGLLFQAWPQPVAIVLGRCLFGWAMFQVTVHLDVLLFQRSRPDDYARDYSLINLFQNLGVIGSSFTAGSLVASQGLSAPFLLAALGFVLSVLSYPLLCDVSSKKAVTA